MKEFFEAVARGFKPKQPVIKTEECEECSGSGTVCYSCCGDDIKGNDFDNCPTCFEHCSLDEEVCESCGGTGLIEVKQ